ncbi:sentrin-specific protease 8-like [Clavelina lepadiformis]|uniref:sentrin-specific protease 8-like n=1 Tax=Clavelina lepadiformis TaxID=159417 RepID=UPI0040437A7F
MDEIIVNYHDSLLRKSDVRLLEPGNWINDKIIGFMFQYFEFELFQNCSDSVKFFDPDLVQLLKLSSDQDAGSILQSLQLHQRFLFLPVNDNGALMTPGGQHWSLLFYDKTSMTFEHYDSMEGANNYEANLISRKLRQVFPGSSSSVAQKPVPKQRNGHDCGIYVITITEQLVASLVGGHHWQATSLSSEQISRERKNIKEIILNRSSTLPSS